MKRLAFALSLLVVGAGSVAVLAAQRAADTKDPVVMVGAASADGAGSRGGAGANGT